MLMEVLMTPFQEQPGAGKYTKFTPLYDALQVNALMEVLTTPFQEQPGAERYTVCPRQTRVGVELLSCSS